MQITPEFTPRQIESFRALPKSTAVVRVPVAPASGEVDDPASRWDVAARIAMKQIDGLGAVLQPVD